MWLLQFQKSNWLRNVLVYTNQHHFLYEIHYTAFWNTWFWLGQLRHSANRYVLIFNTIHGNFVPSARFTKNLFLPLKNVRHRAVLRCIFYLERSIFRTLCAWDVSVHQHVYIENNGKEAQWNAKMHSVWNLHEPVLISCISNHCK